MYIAVNTDFYGFWFAFLFPHPPLVWACEGGLQNSPSPQEFALGPTCLVVKGRGEGNSLDFLSSVVFFSFCFISLKTPTSGREHRTEKW